MKKNLLSLVSTAALTLCLAGNAFATTDIATTKVAVVDMQLVLQKSSEIKNINDQLTKQFKPRQDKIVAAQKTLQEESDKLNKEGSVMSAEARGKLQDKIIKDRADLQSSAMDFQRDVSAAQNQNMRAFMAKFTSTVESVAKNNGFDLVLQRAGVPYAKDNLDITKKVIDQLNK